MSKKGVPEKALLFLENYKLVMSSSMEDTMRSCTLCSGKRRFGKSR